ncbi:MAG: hypothetical protein ABSF27_07750 [Candidatus Dormibacteria bacterium]
MSTEGDRSPAESERYPNLGTKGVSVSSAASADVSIRTSRWEGWLVAVGLLLAGCISMGIYLVVLHH